MNYQKAVPEEVIKILKEKNIDFWDIDYLAWPQTFSSTAGPRGEIGGQAMSTFTVEAYVCDSTGPTVYVCNNCYRFEDKRFEPFKMIKF